MGDLYKRIWGLLRCEELENEVVDDFKIGVWEI